MRRLFLATLLISAAAIGYEILIMRVLSIVQWHHFAYMIISLALLGYGASGAFIAVARARLESRFEQAFSISALLFSVSMVVAFVLGQRVPFNALELVWDTGQLLWLAAIYLVFFVPFFFAACCIGMAFTFRSAAIGRIYFFDLLGAGSGAVIIMAALFILSPQHALLALALFALTGAFLMTSGVGFRSVMLVAQSAWLLLLFIGIPSELLSLRLSDYKGLSQAMQVVDARRIATSSSPLSLLTVVESPTVPFRHAPGLSFGARQTPPEQLAVFSDGDAMSVITKIEDDIASLGYLADVTAALPYQLLTSPRVLVLGAGAGSDVLLALYHGARAVDAVELDPAMIRLVRDDYAQYAGDLYNDPRVRLHVKEARGFVGKSKDQYDLIHIGLLDSFATAGSGVQGLNESYLYTVEAISEYLSHTREGGILSITRWLRLPPRDCLKLAATAIEALQATGVEQPGDRMAVIRSWNSCTLVVKNGAMSDRDTASIIQFAHSRSFDTAWYPGIVEHHVNRYNVLDRARVHEGITALLSEEDAEFRRLYKFNIEPATDNRPYFFHFFRWSTLPELFALRQQGGAGLIEWGYLIVVATIAQAGLIGALLILGPLFRTEREWDTGTGRRFSLYFFLLGLAFLFVEIAFIQKFTLFLSHPLYSVAVVLSGFLVFAGMGSAWSARKLESSQRPFSFYVSRAVFIVAGLSVTYLALLPAAFSALIGLSDPVKIFLSMILIAPLAFVMGIPFPVGLRLVSVRAPKFVPWAWGINGLASVLSAGLATVAAVGLGFNGVVMLAVLMYALAAITLAYEDRNEYRGARPDSTGEA